MTTRIATIALILVAVAACNDKDAHKTDTTTTTNAAAPVVNANPGAHDQTAAADNTKINDRDRHDTVTATDQGNSKDEIAITQAIRQSIVGTSSLSFDAKNAKVITTGTKVTLRGPVKSDDERATIEKLAKSTKGVTEVDNQLEVKK